jgi:hypothetical protein
MNATTVCALAVVVPLLFGCGPAKLSPKSSPFDAAQIPGLDPEERLFLTPTGNPAALLGRAVTHRDGGAWVVAEELAPGCEVTPRETPEAWTRDYQAGSGTFGALSAGVAQVAALNAKYGEKTRVLVHVSNTKILRADLRGPCGELVVKTVKVGTGRHAIQYRREASAGGGIAVLGIGATGGDWEDAEASLEWKEPQAWAFTVGSVAGAEHLELAVEMPTRLRDGEEYTVRVSTKRKIWLVLLYEEADGQVGVLLPNMDHPVITASPGERQPLPTLAVSLRDPAVAANEKLVLFAFIEEEDAKLMRPPAGELTGEQARAYVDQLDAKLAGIPTRRWARYEVSYLIEPM